MNLRWQTRGWGGIGRVRWDFGWLLLVGLFGLLLAASILPARLPGAGSALIGLITLLTLAGSVAAFVFHEWMHAAVARRYGVGTTRVTITLFGGIPEFDRRLPTPESMFLIAASGPAVNLFTGFACFVAAAALAGGPAVFLEVVALVNLLLGVINLVPAQPLDGGRLLHAATWSATGDAGKAFRAEHRVGRILGSIGIVAGITLLLIGAWTAGLFAASLGLLLRSAAHARWLYATGELALAGKPVRDYASAADNPVQRAASVDSVAGRLERLAGRSRLPVVDGTRLTGWIDRARVRRLPQAQWAHETVGSLAVAKSERNTIDGDSDAREALRRMLRERTSTLFVTDGDQLAGVLKLESLLAPGR